MDGDFGVEDVGRTPVGRPSTRDLRRTSRWGTDRSYGFGVSPELL